MKNTVKGFIFIVIIIAVLAAATLAGEILFGEFFGGGAEKIETITPDRTITALMVDTVNNAVTVIPSKDGVLRVTHNEKKDENIDLSFSDDGMLTIKRAGVSFNFFGFGNRQERITVEVPENMISLDVKTTNAMINTGNLHLADDVKLTTTNAVVEVDTMYAGNSIILKTTNSRIYTADIIVSGDFTAKTTNASVLLYEVSAGGNLEAETTNGTIEIEDISSETAIDLSTTNAVIVGNINGNESDFTITSKTTNADNSLTDGGNGSKKLNVKSTNGDIEVYFQTTDS
jgi:hypothetical protein